MKIKPRSRAGSYSTFERRYRPIPLADGSVLRQRNDLPTPVDPAYVWTVLDCDGTLYLGAGMTVVNRMGYVLCEQPWPAEEMSLPGYRY